MLFLLTSLVAQAGPGLTDELDLDFDFDNSPELIDYEGSYSQTTEKMNPNPRLSIIHPGGTISVRCTDTEVVSARISYKIEGTEQDPMKKYGDGIRMAAWGGGANGGVKVVVPYKPSAVKTVSIELTVNVPRAAVLSVNASRDWVSISGCTGFVTAKAGANGAYVAGDMPGFQIAAATGDVTVKSESSELKRASNITASKGKVDLEIPAEIGLRLDARGSSVSITDALVDGVTSEGSAVGNMGAGGTALVIRAGGEVVIHAPAR